MTDLDLETLFAAIGLPAILRGKPTLHKYQLQKAARVPKDIRRRLMRFAATSSFAEGADVPAFDYMETLTAVSPGKLSSEQTRAVDAAVPDRDIAMDLNMMADRIMTWANANLPRMDEQDVMGSQLEEPDPHTVADFRRIWQVACDPLALLDDLEDGSLSEEQVSAVATLYPALYAELRQAVSDALAAVGGRKGKAWRPDPTKAALLKVLRQEPIFDADLAQAMQAMYSQQDQQPQPAAPAPKKRQGQNEPADETSNLTPGQQAEAG